jgi:outer membrane receptor protein involved in Fe transport
MLMRRVIAGLCVALLGLSVPAFAQRTTGSIVGTVTDESGAVLPGVTVTLSGPGVAGTPTTVTGEGGAYRFPSLPPGDYKLTFALAGFSTVTHEQIVVPLGGTVEIAAQLKVSTLQESVTVVGESPVVNTASTEVSTNLNREWVENAPQRRFTFFDLINQAAGVSPATSTSSRSQSFGSSTTDNSYQLDGTDFTAPLTGAAWPWPNTDAIEEVEVLSLGASAEYGNVQGAVFNVVTRQGSNQFHGDGNFYYQHQNLTARNTTVDQECEGVDDCPSDGLPYHRDKFVDTTWQIGGPVKRDKLWFFGSFQYQKDAESQPGTPAEFPARSSAKRIFWKVNWQINNNNRIQAQEHDDYYDIPGRATALTAPSTIGVEHGHNPSPGVMWTSVLSSKTFVEARYSGFYGIDHGDPLEASEPRVKPRLYDLDTGQITGGIYSWYDGDSWKTGATAKLSHFAEKFMGGSHDLKLGVQYDSGGSDYVIGPNDYIYTYGSTPAYGYTQVPYHQGGQKKSWGTFIDDTYRLGNRVTLNLGLRYDWSRASFRSYPVLDAQGNETGEHTNKVSDVFTWNSVSPRVGVIWKLNESGRSMVKLHAGRYYRGVVTDEFDDVTPSVTPRYLFDGTYVGGLPNPDSLVLVSDNTNLTVDRDFKNPYTDQYIAGFEQELITNLGLQVNYIYKRGENYGGWRDTRGTYVSVPYVDDRGVDATGQTINVLQLESDPDQRLFQLTNPDGMLSRYKGLSIQAQKRLSNRWQLTGSIVFSKSTGRLGSSRPTTSSVTPTPIASQVSTAGTFGQNPNDLINSEGRLIGDRPIVAKLQFLYQAPYDILFGVNYMHQDGRLYGRQARISGLGIPTTIWVEPLDGSRRVPDWNTFDVRIEKDFPVGGTTKLAVFGDILNLTNTDTNESVGSQNGTASNFGVPTRFLYPRRLMLGGKIKF